MSLVVTAAPSGELLGVEDVKRHLRLMTGDFDDEVTSLIRAARDYCERYTNRTLRAAVTRTVKLDGWWSTDYALPYPPVLGVTSVGYYDASNVLQTLSAANYTVELSTDGGGGIIWGSSASEPAVYDRVDAIVVTYTAGYADADSLPPVAMQAMKTKITELWGSGTESETEAARKCTDRLLSNIDWTGYA